MDETSALRRSLAIGLVCCAIAACHTHPGSGLDGGPSSTDGGPSSITLQPANATLAVTLGGATTQAYTVLDSHSTDVTSSCAFSVADASFGQFAGSIFTAAQRGGTTQVVASCGGASAMTSLTLTLSGAVVATGAPANSAALFGAATAGTDPTQVPVIEYPIDGAILPLNLPSIDTQWAGGQSDLFHLAITGTNLALDLYTTDMDAQFDDPTWSAIALSGSGSTLMVSVEGLAQATPMTKYASAAVTIKMSVDNISNTTLYYWASNQGNLLSQTFGATGAPTVVKDNCTACHSLSRTGTRIGYSRCVDNDCGYLGFMKASPTGFVDTMNASDKAYRGSYSTFAPLGYPFPDDSEAVALVARDTCNLQLFDPDAGMPIASNVDVVSTHNGTGPAQCATMPDWSPDGKTVVFATQPTGGGGDYVDVTSSSLATMSYTYTGGTHTFGEPTIIVQAPLVLPSGMYTNFFFPSYSPDGGYIVFDAARSGWRNFTDETIPGQRLMLATPTGATPIELANMNGSGDHDLTWPHWAPTASGDYYWVVFSSERDYGHKLTTANTAATCIANGNKQCKQIWIGAIDKTKLGSGTLTIDPSAPPVWMPGQEIGADNISPYWTVPAGIL